MGLGASHPCDGIHDYEPGEADEETAKEALAVLSDVHGRSARTRKNRERQRRSACFGIAFNVETAKTIAQHTINVDCKSLGCVECSTRETMRNGKVRTVYRTCFMRAVGFGYVVGKSKSKDTNDNENEDEYGNIPAGHVLVRIIYPVFAAHKGQMWHAPEADIRYTLPEYTVRDVSLPGNMSGKNVIRGTPRDPCRCLPFDTRVTMMDDKVTLLQELNDGMQKRINYIYIPSRVPIVLTRKNVRDLGDSIVTTSQNLLKSHVSDIIQEIAPNGKTQQSDNHTPIPITTTATTTTTMMIDAKTAVGTGITTTTTTTQKGKTNTFPKRKSPYEEAFQSRPSSPDSLPSSSSTPTATATAHTLDTPVPIRTASAMGNEEGNEEGVLAKLCVYFFSEV